MGTVYLIHFDSPYYHANHYIGYTEKIIDRLSIHRSGNGSPLLRAVVLSGIEWSLVRTWPGVDRHHERRLKNRKKSRHLCPTCNPKSWHKNATQKGVTHHEKET